MSVHEAISKHSREQNERIERFVQLDELRERYIEETIQQCENGESFDVEQINHVTDRINSLARKGIVPQRKRVTIEMIKEYVLEKLGLSPSE
jgi:hypothetical protein